MAILLTKANRTIVQGITGYQGLFHAKKMRDYGGTIVGGVTPGKGGTEIEGFIVWDSVEEAVNESTADTTCIFVPARFAKAAVYEAIDAGIKLIVLITEGVPKIDAMYMINKAIQKGATLIGPNCPGLITPGEAKVGIIPASIVTKGNVGIVSRSGTLTYEVLEQITNAGLGQSTCVGIGGDPYKQTNFIQVLKMFEEDENTEKIVIIGEIGGNAEEAVAQYYESNMKKPMVGFIAGKTAKPGKTMGHAGAIIQDGKGTAQAKIESLRKAGVHMVLKISEIPIKLAEL